MKKNAVLSDCGKYRYQLSRIWDESKPLVMFLMLNPSKADAEEDDPTIRRCIGFAKDWGYGGLMVGNVWAYRATNPKELVNSIELSDEGIYQRQINDKHIHEMYCKADMLILAYGTHKSVTLKRIYQIRQQTGVVHCISTTKKGQPCHPLYLKKELKPILF